MDAQSMDQIKQKMGERATDSKYECSLYTRDMAPVPALLVDPLFKTMPDLVVRPENSEEISEILRLASSRKIPVTPRAGASTVYFDTIPVKGGIVMDLNLIKGIVALDESKKTVTVKAGTTWSELERYLNAKGYAAKTVPSSAPGATIGGWLCMMGYGIGSMKYGSLLSQIKSIEVVLPTGEVRQVSTSDYPQLEWFAASEGTLGVITELEVEIRRLNPMRHFLIHSADLAEALSVLEALKSASMTPYNLHFTDEVCLKAMFKQGIALENLECGCLLAVDYEGTPEELNEAEDLIKDLLSKHSTARLLKEESADEEWNERFKSMKMKRGAPSQLGGEVWLAVGELFDYLKDIQKLAARYKIDMCTYGHVVRSDRMIVMTMFFVDETKTFDYILNLALVKKIQDVGYRHGGYPYGVGLWNTPYLNRIYEPVQLTEMKARKKKLDPSGIMNPGKLYKWPPLMNPFNFGIAMSFLCWIKKLVGRGNR